MDRTSLIIIVVCFVFIGLWTFVLAPKFWPPKPLPPGLTNAPPTQAATAQGTASVNAALSPEAPLVAPSAAANTNIAEELLVVTNSAARFTFSSHGGGLKLVELVQYPETVTARRQKQPLTNRVATLNPFTQAPTLALLGDETVQGDGIFALTNTQTGVRAEKVFANGLVIEKDFQLHQDYLVSATVRLENRSSHPLKLPAQEWVVGTATPMGPRDNGQAVGVMWYDGSSAQDESGTTYFASGGCRQRVPPAEYRGGASNVVWVAVHNQFFALAAMPQLPALSLVARRVDLPRPTGEEAALVATNAPTPQGYLTAIDYPGLTLAPGQTFTNQVQLYAGPKEYRTLAAIGDRLGNKLDLIMNFGWFGFFSKALLLGMNWLHATLRISYGWAIITITVIIKVVFWPLTQASTRSMKRMQALQPQMNAIKEKYKDDQVKMNAKMMEFMREQKVSPLGGCLPMMLQIPVFIGFYSMIRGAIELRGAHFFWAGDLSQPDTVFVIPDLGFVPFFGIPGVGLPINVLPLIMGATMLWQSHLTPPSPGMDPTQAKMMRYLPLIFMVGFYNTGAGLTLYWTVQNLLTIVQTLLTRTKPNPQSPQTPAPVGKGPALTPPAKKRK